METWFQQYVIPDMDGRMCDVAGYGQLRPVGAKWEDGHAFLMGRQSNRFAQSAHLLLNRKTKILWTIYPVAPSMILLQTGHRCTIRSHQRHVALEVAQGDDLTGIVL